MKSVWSRRVMSLGYAFNWWDGWRAFVLCRVMSHNDDKIKEFMVHQKLLTFKNTKTQSYLIIV